MRLNNDYITLNLLFQGILPEEKDEYAEYFAGPMVEMVEETVEEDGDKEDERDTEILPPIDIEPEKEKV